MDGTVSKAGWNAGGLCGQGLWCSHSRQAGGRAGNLWFWGELPASPCLSCLVTPLYTSRGNSLRGYSRPPTFRWEMYAICGFAPFHTVGNWFVFPLLQQSPSLFCSKQTLNSQRQMGKYSGSAQCISMPGLPCSFPASCLPCPHLSLVKENTWKLLKKTTTVGLNVFWGWCKKKS